MADGGKLNLAPKGLTIPCLQLCEASYLSPPISIVSAVAHMPPLAPGGRWQCTWLAETIDESNLAFVALYYASSAVAPDFAVVTIRGTDVYVDNIWGIIEQIWEDGDVTTQVPLPWAPHDPARIAYGTLGGVYRILGLMSGTLSLQTYLGMLVQANAALPLYVTGHSLGGCLTTVVAPLLRLLDVPITPITFAAPTAGNKDFTAYFQRECPQALCYASSLDLAIRAWGDLSSFDTIYQPCGLSIPDLVYYPVLGLQDELEQAGVAYSQPAPAPLKASCSGTATNWYDEGFYQHHPTTYMKWLDGTDIANAPALVMRGGTPPTGARAKLGPLSESMARMRAARSSA
jgi:triacylglycerol lipase